MTINCPKCNSPEWDYANIGFGNALVCTDCGHIYNAKQKLPPLGDSWPFPTLDNPAKAWDNQQIKDYEAVKRSNVPDAPL